MTPLTRSLTAALLGCWLTGGAVAHATTPQVNDEGRFFSAAAVDKASQKINDIYRDYGKDLLIETVPRIPDDLQQRYKALGRRKFFVDWAMKRAEESGCKGVYLLLCKSPGYLQIYVGEVTRRRGFTLEDRNRLFHTMRPFLDKKDQKNNDAALMLAVNTVESTLRSNLGKRQPPDEKQEQGEAGMAEGPAKPASTASAPRASVDSPQAGEGLSLWTWILIGAGVVVVWLLMALLRAMSGGRGGAGGFGQTRGGRGGFFTLLLAGLLGVAAGASLHDTFLHAGASGQAFAASTSDQTTPAANEPSDSDDDGGGGEFGDDTGEDTGGGEFGDSDDTGGGDFGDDDDFGGGGEFGDGDLGDADFEDGDFGGSNFQPESAGR